LTTWHALIKTDPRLSATIAPKRLLTLSVRIAARAVAWAAISGDVTGGCAGSPGLPRLGGRPLQQHAQLAEVALLGSLVVGGCVRHGVAVLCALVHLGAIARPGLVERVLESGHLLRAHARVLVGE